MISEAKPIVVTISHQLGRDEARRRLDDGLDQIRRIVAPFANSINFRWAGYRLDFSVTALRQRINGQIDIEDSLLRIELGLPLLLNLLARKIVRRIRDEGSRLLEKPTR